MTTLGARPGRPFCAGLPSVDGHDHRPDALATGATVPVSVVHVVRDGWPHRFARRAAGLRLDGRGRSSGCAPAPTGGCASTRWSRGRCVRSDVATTPAGTRAPRPVVGRRWAGPTVRRATPSAASACGEAVLTPRPPAPATCSSSWPALRTTHGRRSGAVDARRPRGRRDLDGAASRSCGDCPRVRPASPCPRPWAAWARSATRSRSSRRSPDELLVAVVPAGCVGGRVRQGRVPQYAAVVALLDADGTELERTRTDARRPVRARPWGCRARAT